MHRVFDSFQMAATTCRFLEHSGFRPTGCNSTATEFAHNWGRTTEDGITRKIEIRMFYPESDSVEPVFQIMVRASSPKGRTTQFQLVSRLTVNLGMWEAPDFLNYKRSIIESCLKTAVETVMRLEPRDPVPSPASDDDLLILESNAR